MSALITIKDPDYTALKKRCVLSAGNIRANSLLLQK